MGYKKNLFFQIGIWIFLWITSASLPAQTPEIYGGQFKYGENEYPDILYPVFSFHNSANIRITELIFESLLDLNEVGGFVPKLAAEMPDKEGREITFRLKENLIWHDGQPLSSNDVKFTFDLIRNSDFRIDPYWKGLLSNISGCEVLDRHRIRFVLQREVEDPDYLFTFKILPRHIVNRYSGRQLSSESLPVVGSGPFQFHRQEASQIELNANTQYHSRRAYLEKIIIELIPDPNTFFQSLSFGGLDAVIELPYRNLADVQTSGKFVIRQFDSESFIFLAYNLNKPPLNRRAFRQAVSSAIDRESILNIHFYNKGRVIAGPLSSGSLFANPGVQNPEFNPSRAGELLEAAGLPDENGDGMREFQGRPVKLSLKIEMTSPRKALEEAAEAIREYLGDIGIQVELRFLSPADFYETVLQQGDFDMALATWRYNPLSDVSDLFHSDGRYNFISYSNSQADRYMDFILNASDTEVKRLAAYRLQELLMDEQPCSFLWNLNKFAAIHRKVRGTETIHPFKFFTFIQDWYIPKDFQ